VPVPLRRAFTATTGPLRRSDAAAARTAAAYAVNSTAVADRVRDVYGIEATVVAPARGLSPDGPTQAIPGVAPGFWLNVGRARGYKQTDVVCGAMARLPEERLVVVGGLPDGKWTANVVAPDVAGDAQLRWLYANATGLVAVAKEDFGLTPVEAQAFGIPVVALRAGGYLDSTVEGSTGVFVDEVTPEAVAAGIRDARSRSWDAAQIRRIGARYSPEAFTARIRDLTSAVLADITNQR